MVQLKTLIENNQSVVKNIFYDAQGRVSSEQNPYFETFNSSISTPSNTTNKTYYTYDALDRVIKVVNPDNTNKTINFNKYSITDYDENNHRHEYLLDSFGRITNVIEYNFNPNANNLEEGYNTSYQYDTNDNLIKITDNVGNEFKLTYDANGNLVTGDGYFRVYNSLNQLWKVHNGTSTSGKLLEDYTYHPIEERVLIKKVYYLNTSLKETVYYVSDEFVRVVNSSGTYNTVYVKHEGQLIAEQKNNSNKLFYHPDHLGSTTLITNQSGNVVDNVSYSPLG